MSRVFAVDVLECPRCKGSMRIVTPVFPPDATRAHRGGDTFFIGYSGSNGGMIRARSAFGAAATRPHR